MSTLSGHVTVKTHHSLVIGQPGYLPADRSDLSVSGGAQILAVYCHEATTGSCLEGFPPLQTMMSAFTHHH
jgi:hypothetical protein